MVLNGNVDKFIFRCNGCSGTGVSMFGKKKVIMP